MSLEKPSPPQPEQENPYTIAGPPPNVFEDFQGIDTQVPRIGVPDQKMAWSDGFFPVTKRNLRTLPGKGALFYTASGVLTIMLFGFYEINNISYAVVFLSDGSIVQVRVSDGATTQIAPANTITNPTIVSVGFTDYSDQYLIIVSNQPNGYWLWDGTLFYQAGTLSPIVTITNVGSAYKTVPSVVASGGSGSGATFVATINAGVVTSVVVTNPGTGYLPGQTITLGFFGGNSGGSGGALTAVLSNTGSGSGAAMHVSAVGVLPDTNLYISAVTVTLVGSGYSQFAVLTVGFSGTTVHPAVLQPVISGGSITGVTIQYGGEYVEQFSGPNTFTITITDNGAFHVTSVTVNNPGTGYSPSATATCSLGGNPIAQATLQLVLSGTGSISSVTVASGGLYGSNTPPTVTIIDSPASATATAQLMPFGINGTTVETYAGHVWVANGPNVNGSAPGSPVDFATSDGGVSFTSPSNSFSQLLSTNGFLFLIGDSATDYISGVTTTVISSVPTTQYTYLNADPEVGSPYPASVLTLGNQIVLANAVGVYQLAGSTFTKVSDDLDGSGIPNGLWGSVANFGGNQLSSTKATIFNKRVWMVLATVLDPISGSQVNKLFLWNGQFWCASEQDMTLTFVASYENNSVLTAYGTDGTHIYPLFQTPSTGFTKTVQSRLWDGPGGYMHVKAATRLFGIAYVFNSASPSFTVSIDNENGQMVTPYTITPAATGYFEVPPEAVGQQGVMMGLTIATSAADLSLVSVALQEIIAGYRG